MATKLAAPAPDPAYLYNAKDRIEAYIGDVTAEIETLKKSKESWAGDKLAEKRRDLAGNQQALKDIDLVIQGYTHVDEGYSPSSDDIASQLRSQRKYPAQPEDIIGEPPMAAALRSPPPAKAKPDQYSPPPMAKAKPDQYSPPPMAKAKPDQYSPPPMAKAKPDQSPLAAALRKDTPQFRISNAQREGLKYDETSNDDERMRNKIVAGIATGDPSAGDYTDEQLQYVVGLTGKIPPKQGALPTEDDLTPSGTDDFSSRLEDITRKGKSRFRYPQGTGDDLGEPKLPQPSSPNDDRVGGGYDLDDPLVVGGQDYDPNLVVNTDPNKPFDWAKDTTPWERFIPLHIKYNDPRFKDSNYKKEITKAFLLGGSTLLAGAVAEVGVLSAASPEVRQWLFEEVPKLAGLEYEERKSLGKKLMDQLDEVRAQEGRFSTWEGSTEGLKRVIRRVVENPSVLSEIQQESYKVPTETEAFELAMGMRDKATEWFGPHPAFAEKWYVHLSSGLGSWVAGAGVAMMFGPYLGSGFFFAANAGEAVMEAFESGKATRADLDTVARWGMIAGIPDAFSAEVLLGRAKLPGIDRLRINTSLLPKAWRFVAEIGKRAFFGILTEGPTEAAQSRFLSALAKYVYEGGKNAEEKALQEGLVGAGVGGIAGTLLELMRQAGLKSRGRKMFAQGIPDFSNIGPDGHVPIMNVPGMEETPERDAFGTPQYPQIEQKGGTYYDPAQGPPDVIYGDTPISPVGDRPWWGKEPIPSPEAPLSAADINAGGTGGGQAGGFGGTGGGSLPPTGRPRPPGVGGGAAGPVVGPPLERGTVPFEDFMALMPRNADGDYDFNAAHRFMKRVTRGRTDFWYELTTGEQHAVIQNLRNLSPDAADTGGRDFPPGSVPPVAPPAGEGVGTGQPGGGGGVPPVLQPPTTGTGPLDAGGAPAGRTTEDLGDGYTLYEPVVPGGTWSITTPEGDTISRPTRPEVVAEVERRIRGEAPPTGEGGTVEPPPGETVQPPTGEPTDQDLEDAFDEEMNELFGEEEGVTPPTGEETAEGQPPTAETGGTEGEPTGEETPAEETAPPVAPPEKEAALEDVGEELPFRDNKWKDKLGEDKEDNSDDELARILRLTERAKLIPIKPGKDASPGTTVALEMFRNGLPGFTVYAAERLFTDVGMSSWQKSYSVALAEYDLDNPENLSRLHALTSKYITTMTDLGRLAEGVTSVEELSKRMADKFFSYPTDLSIATFYDQISEIIKTNPDNITDLAEYTQSLIDPLKARNESAVSSIWSVISLFRRVARVDENTAKKKPVRWEKEKLENLKREELPEYRAGRDISPTELKDTFGLKTVNFGDYARGKDGQLHMNHAFDALMDLAIHVGMDPKDVGLGGKLALSIGRYGRGRHSAHFDPNIEAINMTKGNGDGSLAHEWSHALDHFLSKTPEGEKAVKDVEYALRFKYDLEKVEKELDLIIRGGMWYTGSKRDRLESAQIHLRRARNKSSDTEFYKNAKKMDKGKSPKYWSKVEELFARAFESSTYDLIKGSTPYLVNSFVADGKVTEETGYVGTPYAKNGEREEFDNFHTHFLGGIEWTDQGPQMKADYELIVTPRREAYWAALEKLRESLPNRIDKKERREQADFSSDPIINGFAQTFLKGRRFPEITDARRYAQSITGDAIEPGTPEAKALDEKIERAVVHVARYLVTEGERLGDSPQDIYDTLVDLYNRMPKLSVRTSTSVREQAYSTPVPLAYLAAKAGGIASDSKVYEPTVGHGALLITADQENIRANELNPTRNDAFREDYPNAALTQEDASDWKPDGEFDTIIANPPFGKVTVADQPITFKIDDKYSTQAVDHAIAMKALSTMRDGGTAVLLVGGINKLKTTPKERSDGYSSQTMRSFYFTLYNQYNVVDHFTVAGDLYARQGAGWPIDVIVIQGRGKSDRKLPAADVPKQYESWDALKEIFDAEYAADRSVIGEDGVPDGQQPTSDGGRGGSVSGEGATPRPGVGEQGGTEGTGEGTTGGVTPPAGTRAGEGTDEAGGTRDTGRPDTEAGAVDEDAELEAAFDEEMEALFGEEEQAPKDEYHHTYDSKTRELWDVTLEYNWLRQNNATIDEVGRHIAGVLEIAGDALREMTGATAFTKTGGRNTTYLAEKIRRMHRYGKQRDLREWRSEPGREESRRIAEVEALASKLNPNSREGRLARDAILAVIRRLPGELRRSSEELAGLVGVELEGVERPPKQPPKEPTEKPQETAPTEQAPTEEADDMASVAADIESILGGTKASVRRDLGTKRSVRKDFDPETYEQLKPVLIRGAEKVYKAGQAAVETVRLLVRNLKEVQKMAADTLKKLRAYIIQFSKDLSDGTINFARETSEDLKEFQSEDRIVGQQVSYTPASKGGAMDTLVPKNLKAPLQEALKKLEAQIGNKYKSLDEYVADKLGYDSVNDLHYQKAEGNKRKASRFGAEQVDALALAIHNVENGAGFIIGDQTGIGKGRVVAAMLRYAVKEGLTPIFVTQTPELHAAMLADMEAIGMEEFLGHKPNVLLTANALKLKDPVTDEVLLETPKGSVHQPDLQRRIDNSDLGADFIFTTYKQMQTYRGNTLARHALVRHFAQGSMLVLDESHKAGGQEGKVVKEGEQPASLFFREMVDMAHGVVYSSATYAKRPGVMDLYASTDMRLAVADPSSLGDYIKRGGIPLQQIVAQMLADAGQYVRRERTFDGVEYRSPTVDVSRETYSDYTRLLKFINDFTERYIRAATSDIDDGIKGGGGVVMDDGSTGMGGADSIKFTSIMHNLINQMLLSIKADAAADLAIQARGDGEVAKEKVVLTVANTMGSFIEEMSKEDNLNIKPGDEMDLSFQDLLEKYLQRVRTITIRDAYGEKEKHYLTDEELGPEGVKAFETLTQRIKDTDLGDLPISPIDHMHYRLKQAGIKTGEITGRTATIEKRADGRQYYRNRSGAEKGPQGKLSSIEGFNNGDIDVLIINQSGSTGISLHAGEYFRNQQPRRMILVQAEADIDTHMQMLGRIHRTGQVSLPSYDQLVASVAAEKRPAAVLSMKMASLNANTTAAREHALQAEDVPDFFNQFGDVIVARIMSDDTELHDRLTAPLSLASGANATGFEPEGAVRKVTGRIPLLEVQEQDDLYELIEEEYTAFIEQMKESGENPLEAGFQDLDAKTMTKDVVVAAGEEDSPFAEAVFVEVVSAKRLGKPPTSEEVINLVGKAVGTEQRGGGGTNREQLEFLKDTHQSVHVFERNKALDKFVDYRTELLDDMEDGARKTNTELRLSTLLERFKSLHATLRPGNSIKIMTSTSGNHYGVVVDIRSSGKTKNPLALGAWRVTVAIPTMGNGKIVYPLSQLYTGDISPSDTDQNAVTIENARLIRNFYNPATKKTQDMPVIDLFDNFQAEVKEDRTIYTGNVLAAYDYISGRGGTILNFSDSDGQVRPGILMARDYDHGKKVKNDPVTFRSGEQVMEFLKLGYPVDTVDTFVKMLNVSGDRLRIDVQIGKRKGAKYYEGTNQPKIEAAAGTTFASVGRSMRLFVDADKHLAAIEAFRAAGAVVIANNNKEAASSIVAGPAEDQTKASARRGPITRENVGGVSLEAGPDGTQLYLTPEFEAAREELKQETLKILRSMKIPGVKVKVADTILDASGRESAGMYNAFENTIYMSLDTEGYYASHGQGGWTARHEAFHALKAMGLISEQEWAILTKAAETSWRKEHKIDKRYPELKGDNEALNEEGMGDAYASWAVGNLKVGGLILRAFKRIRSFLAKLKNALAGRGFNSVDSIFAKIESGEVGSRAAPTGTEITTMTEFVKDLETKFAWRMPEDNEAAYRDTSIHHQNMLDKLWYRLTDTSVPIGKGKRLGFKNYDVLGTLHNAAKYLDLRGLALGKIGEIDEIAKRVDKVFSTASEAVQAQVYHYLTNKNARHTAIDDRAVAEEALWVKNEIMNIGDNLVRRKMLRQEVVDKLEGEYLPRIYLKFLLQERGLGTSGQPKQGDRSYLKPRSEKLDADEETRMLIMGEITDPGFLAAAGLSKPKRDMVILDFLEQIKNVEDWIFPKTMVIWRGQKVTAHYLATEAARMRHDLKKYPKDRQDDVQNLADEMSAVADPVINEVPDDFRKFKQVPNSAKYGKLRGLYIRSEIYNDVVASGGWKPQGIQSLDTLYGMSVKATAWWKMGKVALNLPSQARNFVSNMMLLHLSGVNAVMVLPRVIQAFHEAITGKGKHFLIAKKHGMFQTTFAQQELIHIERRLRRVQSRKLPVLSQMASVAHALADFASWSYGGMESISKTAKIIDEMAKGRSEAEAARQAEKWLFDYSLVHPAVRHIRQSPFGIPFITFTYKSLPRVLETVVRRPWKFLPYYGLIYGMVAWLAHTLDVDDDDFDSLELALEKWLREKGNAFVLPVRDDYGRWQFVDMSYLFPWGQHWEILSNMANGRIKEAIEGTGLFGAPVQSLITGFKTNIDPFTKREIARPGDTRQRQFAARMGWLWRLSMPTMITDQSFANKALESFGVGFDVPGTPITIGGTGKDSRGKPKLTPLQGLVRGAGVNIYPVNAMESRAKNIRRMRFEINEIRQQAKFLARSRSLSPQQRKSRLEDSKATIQERVKELREYSRKSLVPPPLR